jgi:hypothetical protein
MEKKRTINPLPEIAVFHGNHSPEPLPLPIVGAPFGHTETQSTADVPTFGDERYACRTVECFQSTDNGKQLKAFATHGRFFVGDDHSPTGLNVLQDESPGPGVGSATCFGEKQVVGCGYHGNKPRRQVAGPKAGYGAKLRLLAHSVGRIFSASVHRVPDWSFARLDYVIGNRNANSPDYRLDDSIGLIRTLAKQRPEPRRDGIRAESSPIQPIGHDPELWRCRRLLPK